MAGDDEPIILLYLRAKKGVKPIKVELPNDEPSQQDNSSSRAGTSENTVRKRAGCDQSGSSSAEKRQRLEGGAYESDSRQNGGNPIRGQAFSSGIPPAMTSSSVVPPPPSVPPHYQQMLVCPVLAPHPMGHLQHLPIGLPPHLPHDSSMTVRQFLAGVPVFHPPPPHPPNMHYPPLLPPAPHFPMPPVYGQPDLSIELLAEMVNAVTRENPSSLQEAVDVSANPAVDAITATIAAIREEVDDPDYPSPPPPSANVLAMFAPDWNNVKTEVEEEAADATAETALPLPIQPSSSAGSLIGHTVIETASMTAVLTPPTLSPLTLVDEQSPPVHTSSSTISPAHTVSSAADECGGSSSPTAPPCSSTGATLPEEQPSCSTSRSDIRSEVRREPEAIPSEWEALFMQFVRTHPHLVQPRGVGRGGRRRTRGGDVTIQRKNPRPIACNDAEDDTETTANTPIVQPQQIAQATQPPITPGTSATENREGSLVHDRRLPGNATVDVAAIPASKLDTLFMTFLKEKQECLEHSDEADAENREAVAGLIPPTEGEQFTSNTLLPPSDEANEVAQESQPPITPVVAASDVQEGSIENQSGEVGITELMRALGIPDAFAALFKEFLREQHPHLAQSSDETTTQDTVDDRAMEELQPAVIVQVPQVYLPPFPPTEAARDTQEASTTNETVHHQPANEPAATPSLARADEANDATEEDQETEERQPAVAIQSLTDGYEQHQPVEEPEEDQEMEQPPQPAVTAQEVAQLPVASDATPSKHRQASTSCSQRRKQKQPRSKKPSSPSLSASKRGAKATKSAARSLVLPTTPSQQSCDLFLFVATGDTERPSVPRPGCIERRMQERKAMEKAKEMARPPSAQQEAVQPEALVEPEDVVEEGAQENDDTEAIRPIDRAADLPGTSQGSMPPSTSKAMEAVTVKMEIEQSLECSFDETSNGGTTRRRSTRGVKVEVKEEVDENNADNAFCDGNTGSNECPRCGMVVEETAAKKHAHYKAHHYDVFFATARIRMGVVERWVSERIGGQGCGRARDARVCLMCKESGARMHDGRVTLLRHIQKEHAAEFPKLKEAYRIFSRNYPREISQFSDEMRTVNRILN